MRTGALCGDASVFVSPLMLDERVLQARDRELARLATKTCRRDLCRRSCDCRTSQSGHALSRASSSVLVAIQSLSTERLSLFQKNLGGQLNIFQTSLPTVGPGALKHREDPKLYGTDKEKTLFTIQDPFYRVSAEECVEAGIGINLFLFPSQYIDAATLGVLPGLTGGDLFFHPRFDPVRDGQLLREEIGRVVKRETAYSVTMRIRCSNGECLAPLIVALRY